MQNFVVHFSLLINAGTAGSFKKKCYGAGTTRALMFSSFGFGVLFFFMKWASLLGEQPAVKRHGISVSLRWLPSVGSKSDNESCFWTWSDWQYQWNICIEHYRKSHSYIHWLNSNHMGQTNYLAVVIDMVISLILRDTVLVVDSSSFPTRTLKYAGWFGLAKILALLLSIATTSNMVGRSAAFSCTHNNPMFMHLMISVEWCMGTNEESMSSLHLPSSYNCHACL